MRRGECVDVDGRENGALVHVRRAVIQIAHTGSTGAGRACGM